jgi:hypothetical protein
VTADVLQLERQQASLLQFALWRELALLRDQLLGFAQPNWTEQSFLNAEEYLLALPEQGGNSASIRLVAEGLGAWEEQLSGRHPGSSADGLSVRERAVIHNYLTRDEHSEQHSRSATAPLQTYL